MRVVILIGLTVLLTVAALTQPPLHEVAPGGEGLHAYLDPATGTFIEPPAEVKALWAAEAAGQAAQKAAAPLSEFAGRTPAGGVGVAFEGHFDSALVATVAPDGALTYDCLEAGSEEAR